MARTIFCGTTKRKGNLGNQLMKSVILIGDSIRGGYQATAMAALEGEAKLWVPEANGGDSANVLNHLEEWVIERRPDILHLNCGLHDIKRDEKGANIQVPLPAYRQNLERIFQQIHDQTRTRILWASTTPVNEKQHLTVKYFVRLNADVATYNAAALELAKQFDIPVNDLHAAVEAIGAATILQPDGVHFTEEGSRRLGLAVADFIRNYL